jgi:hypothetical protein
MLQQKNSAPSAVAADSTERRATIRYAAHKDGSCFSASAGRAESVSVWLRDVSTSGMGLVAERRFEPGTLLVVDLKDGDEATRFSPLARVARVTRGEGRSWFHGCTLLGLLTSEELQDLIDEALPTS